MQFNRGDTFEFSGPVTVRVNGVETDDLTGYEAASQVRTEDGRLIGVLTCSFLNRQPAILHVVFDGDTSGWRVGKALIDVEFTDPSGRFVSTPAVAFLIKDDVTKRVSP